MKLLEQDPEIFNSIEKERQKYCLELIASENFTKFINLDLINFYN